MQGWSGRHTSAWEHTCRLVCKILESTKWNRETKERFIGIMNSLFGKKSVGRGQNLIP